MKIEIIKEFNIELKGFKCTVTYDEAKYLYDELNKEFGYNAEKFWEDTLPEGDYAFKMKDRYNIQQVPNDVPNGGYTSNGTTGLYTGTELGGYNEYVEFLRKNRL